MQETKGNGAFRGATLIGDAERRPLDPCGMRRAASPSDTVSPVTVEAPAVPTGVIALSVRDSGASFGTFQMAHFQPRRASLRSSAYLLFPFTVFESIQLVD
jgi:hypothetical protein